MHYSSSKKTYSHPGPSFGAGAAGDLSQDIGKADSENITTDDRNPTLSDW